MEEETKCTKNSPALPIAFGKIFIGDNSNETDSNSNIVDLNSNGNRTRESDESYHIIDSRKLRRRIIENKIYPAYEKEIDEGLIWRNKWAKISSCFFTLTFLIMSVSTIVSFSAPQFPEIGIISYSAGCLGVIALISDRFAHYCSSQSTSNTKRVNMLMRSIGINDSIPDVALSSLSDGAMKELDDNIFKDINEQNKTVAKGSIVLK